jgi:GntR family transcriptional regulator, transcriptional repressor for pyruvate dehydrogenase complex
VPNKLRLSLLAIERPSTLVDEVVRTIQAEIAAGNFARSSRLPSEGDLARALAVSRTVVREAISQLRADGVLVSRKGSGVYVSESPEGNVFRLSLLGSSAAHDVRHVFELRFWAEAAAAELAAARRTPEDLERLEAALREIDEQSGDVRAAAASDVSFHRAIAVATHNPYFVTFVHLLGRQLFEVRRAAWANTSRFVRGSRPAQREHAALYRAIKAGDPSAARKAAIAHLRGAAGRMRIDLPWTKRSS